MDSTDKRGPKFVKNAEVDAKEEIRCTVGKLNYQLCSDKVCNLDVLESGERKTSIVCPKCLEETKIEVECDGAASVPLVYKRPSVPDSSKIETEGLTLVCTSCASQMLAMSKCLDCALCLCCYCYSAHQMMYCFKKHQVVRYVDYEVNAMVPTDSIVNKPVACNSHPNETLTRFCFACKIPVCEKCVFSKHLVHQYECRSWETVLPEQKEDLKKLVEETKAKATFFQQISSSLESCLSMIKSQYENSKDLIWKKYDIYETRLKKCKKESFAELDRLRREQEVKVTRICRDMTSASEKTKEVCKFISQALKYGNALEIVFLKQVVSVHIENMTNIPQPPLDFDLILDKALSAFDDSVRAAFTSTSASASNIQSKEADLKDTAVVQLTRASPIGVSVCSRGDFPAESSLDYCQSLCPSDAQNIKKHASRSKYLKMDVCLKFGKQGSSEGEFYIPCDLCLGWQDDIIVADTENHRVQIFNKKGVYKYQFGGFGEKDGEFIYPTKIAAFQEVGNLVVGDQDKFGTRLQLFTKDGVFIKRLHGGNTFNKGMIEVLAALTVTQGGYVVAVDKVSLSVFVITVRGDILLRLNCSAYLSDPSDISVWDNHFYVSDFSGQAVVLFDTYGTLKCRIERRSESKWRPTGVHVTKTGTVLVGDSDDSRFHIVAFDRQGKEAFAYESSGRVHRCCGLEVMSDGKVVTLACTEGYVMIAK